VSRVRYVRAGPSVGYDGKVACRQFYARVSHKRPDAARVPVRKLRSSSIRAAATLVKMHAVSQRRRAEALFQL